MAVSPLWRSAFFYFWMLGFVICSSGLGAKNRDQSIGMRRIVTQVADVDVGVRFFYPSFEHAAVTGFGAWMLPLVKNARLRAGTYPLVMVSHGLGGNSWNHHLLAQSLENMDLSWLLWIIQMICCGLALPSIWCCGLLN